MPRDAPVHLRREATPAFRLRVVAPPPGRFRGEPEPALRPAVDVEVRAVPVHPAVDEPVPGRQAEQIDARRVDVPRVAALAQRAEGPVGTQHALQQLGTSAEVGELSRQPRVVARAARVGDQRPYALARGVALRTKTAAEHQGRQVVVARPRQVVAPHQVERAQNDHAVPHPEDRVVDRPDPGQAALHGRQDVVCATLPRQRHPRVGRKDPRRQRIGPTLRDASECHLDGQDLRRLQPRKLAAERPTREPVHYLEAKPLLAARLQPEPSRERGRRAVRVLVGRCNPAGQLGALDPQPRPAFNGQSRRLAVPRQPGDAAPGGANVPDDDAQIHPAGPLGRQAHLMVVHAARAFSPKLT